MKLAEAFVEVRVDDSKIKGDMRGVETKVGDSGKRVASTFAQVFGAAAFGAGIKSAIDQAGRLEQAVGATETVFGSAGKRIDDFAKHSAESAGLSQAAFRELTGTIGALLQNLGYTQDQAAGTSVKLTQLGADLAAAFGGKPEDAVAALGSALRGEFDPLEQFGVKLSQAQIQTKALELGLYSGKGALDANAQAQAALALITEQTAKVQGQFARESDSASGSATIAAAKAQDSAASLGKNFLPVYQKIVQLVGLAADAFGALPAPVQLGVVALAGLVALSGPIKSLVGIAKDVTAAIAKIPEATKSAGLALGVLAGVTLVGLSLRSDEVTKSNKRMTESFNALSSVSGPELLDQFVIGLSRAAIAGHGTDDALKKLTQTNLEGAKKALDYAEALDRQGKLADGQRSLFDRLRAAIVAEDAAQAEAAATQEKYGTAADGATKATDALRAATSGLSPIVADAAERQAELDARFKAAADSAQLTADGVTTARHAMQDLGGSTPEIAGLSKAVDDLADKSDDAATEADALQAALDKLFGSAIDLAEGARGVTASIQDVTKTLKENKGSLDDNTEAGRANKDAIDKSVKAIQDQGVEMLRQGSTTQQVTGYINDHINSLINQSSQSGKTKMAVGEYITQLGLTPEQVETAITLAGDEVAKAKIQEFRDKLGGIPPSKATEIQALIDEGSYAAAASRLEILSRNRTMSISIQTKGGVGYDTPVNGRSAEGRFVAGGSNFATTTAEIPGSRGDEVILPLGNPSRLAALLGDQRVGPRVATAMGGGASYSGGSPTHADVMTIDGPMSGQQLAPFEWHQHGNVYGVDDLQGTIKRALREYDRYVAQRLSKGRRA